MKAQIPYWQKLKDPRWQRVRLRILEQAGFKCSHCDDGTKELHVHHVNYEKGAEPWEYDDCDLVALCTDCHEGVEDNIRACRDTLARCPEWSELIPRLMEILLMSCGGFLPDVHAARAINSVVDATNASDWPSEFGNLTPASKCVAEEMRQLVKWGKENQKRRTAKMAKSPTA